MHPDAGATPQVTKATEDAGPPKPRERWAGAVAVTTAILAALASISSLLTARHTDEAMIDQVRASDQWSYYQAKSVKLAVLRSKMELLTAAGRQPIKDDTDQVAKYEDEEKKIESEAKDREAMAKDHRAREAITGRAATMFQISIALCAIALLTKRIAFWQLALIGGAVGSAFLVQSLL